MTYESIFAALADPQRQCLVQQLRAGPRSVTELADGLPISRPAVSQHLRVLSDAGLLSCDKVGTKRLYRLEPQALDSLRSYAEELWRDALAAFAARAETLAKEAAMSLDPIVKTVTVPLSPETAFDVFTTRLDEWWPTESHSLAAYEGDVPASVTVPSEPGAQIMETKKDGSTAPWGRVSVHERGRRLAMSWHVGRPEEEATQIDIRFDPDPQGCRVTLIHDGWTARGDQATAMRANYFVGWDLVLGARFVAACQAQAAA